MKKIIAFISLITLALILVACNKVHTVSFDLNGAPGEIESQSVKANTLAIEPDKPTYDGYNFDGWYLDGDRFDFNTKIVKDITLVAVWENLELETYTVSFDYNNSSTQVQNIDVLEGELVSQPNDPERVGYEFLGWYLNSSKFDFNTPITSNITLEARWEKEVLLSERNLYTLDFGDKAHTGYDSSSITFSNGDGENYTFNKSRAQINNQDGKEDYFFVMSPISTNKVSYLELDLSNIQNPSKISFDFRAWNKTSLNSINKFTNAHLGVDKKIGNTWVSMEGIENASNVINLINLDDFSYVEFELDNPAIYRIRFETPNVSNTGNTTQALVINEVSVYHLVEGADSLIVTYNYGYDGVPNVIDYVEPGSTLEETEEPTRKAHNFLGWYLGNNEYDFNEPVTGDIQLVAKWERSEYIIRYDLGYLTDNMLIDQLVDIGNKPTPITNPTRDGYTFAGWYQTEINRDHLNSYNFNKDLTEDIRLIAKWEKDIEDPVYTRDDSKLESYYSGLSGKAGKALVDELQRILTESHNPVNYGQARYALEVADRHPEQEDQVLTIYDRDMVYGPWNHPIWEREHVWPNSKLGVPRANNNTTNQASDLHNLRAIIPTVNQRRGNRYMVGSMGAPIGHVVGDGTYYPGDEDIGDVARIFLYMAVRYDVLKLTDDHSKLRNEGANSTPAGAYMGKLSLLYEWHLKDPVDDFEINRNSIIASEQGNRNPFIDHPELFKEVWEYLNTLDSDRLENLDSIEIIIDNEYVVKVDITFFKQRKNELVS